MSLQSLIKNWWNQKTPAQKQEFLMQNAQNIADRIIKHQQKQKANKKEKEE